MFVSVAGVKVVNTLYWFAAAVVPLWLVETQRAGPLLVGGVEGQPFLLLCALAGAGANLWFMSRLSRLHPGAQLSLRMLSFGAASFAVGGVCAGANVLLPYLEGGLGLDPAVPSVPVAGELERLLFSLPLWIAAGAAVGSLWLGFFTDRT